MKQWLVNMRVIIVAACVLRLAVIIITGFIFPERAFLTDSDSYITIATNLREHGVFSQQHEAPFLPDMMRTPLYPVLLFLFNFLGNEIVIMLLAQLILSVATCFLVLRITNQITGNKTASAIAGWLIALDIPSIIFTGFILTETVFTFLLVVFVWYIIKFLQTKNIKHLLLSSIFLGLGILCRPVILFLPLILIVWLLIYRKHFRASHFLLFLLPVTLLISSWICRNTVIFGQPFFSRIGAFNLAWFQASSACAEAKNINLTQARWEIFSEARKRMKQLPVENPTDFYNQLTAVSFRNIFAQKRIVLKNMAKAEANLLFRPSVSYTAYALGMFNLPNGEVPPDFTKNSTLIILTIVQLLLLAILYLGIAVSLWNIRLLKSPAWWLLLFIFIYFLIPGTGPEMDARFRIPLLPVLVILSASGWKNVLKTKTPQTA